jgi:hypothetical protein
MAASRVVLRLVESLTILLSLSFCLQGISQTTSQRAQAAISRLFRADDRVDLVIPSRSLTLLEKNEISMRIHVPGVGALGCSQGQFYDDDTRKQPPESVNGSSMQLTLLQRSDGSNYVEVVPLRLGKVEFVFSGNFPDGGVFLKRVTFDVGPPPTLKPVRLIVGRRGLPSQSAPWIPLYLDENKLGLLVVNARYDNVVQLIRINPSFAIFKIRQANDVVKVDESTGLLTPLHVGHALIETSFGGQSALTCVQVNGSRSGPFGDPYTNCEDLLRPGEQLRPTTPVHKTNELPSFNR